VETHKVVRRRDSHIFGSQIALRLSALCAGRLFTQEESWYSVVSGSVDSRTLVSWNDQVSWKIQWLHLHRTRDLPACSIVPQSIMLPLAPSEKKPQRKELHEDAFPYLHAYIHTRAVLRVLTPWIRFGEHWPYGAMNIGADPSCRTALCPARC
jgi:hypothetical protein